MLRQRGAHVTFSDPYVPTLRIKDDICFSTDMIESVRNADCIVIVTDHSGLDYSALVVEAKLIVDTRNALQGVQSPKIVRL